MIFERARARADSSSAQAFGSALEILTLYAQRPIVDKQARYRMIHPSAEAFASMATDMPCEFVLLPVEESGD